MDGHADERRNEGPGARARVRATPPLLVPARETDSKAAKREVGWGSERWSALGEPLC